jgi:hypothetical protein
LGQVQDAIFLICVLNNSKGGIKHVMIAVTAIRQIKKEAGRPKAIPDPLEAL